MQHYVVVTGFVFWLDVSSWLDLSGDLIDPRNLIHFSNLMICFHDPEIEQSTLSDLKFYFDSKISSIDLSMMKFAEKWFPMDTDVFQGIRRNHCVSVIHEQSTIQYHIDTFRIFFIRKRVFEIFLLVSCSKDMQYLEILVVCLASICLTFGRTTIDLSNFELSSIFKSII